MKQPQNLAETFAPRLIEYYDKVYGINISEIAELEFPKHDYLHAFMAVSPKHDEGEIMQAQADFFKIGISAYKNPVAENIDREEESRIQKRPSGLYVFAHSDEDEPDEKHRRKSYDDAIAEKLQFQRSKEYLLATGFKKFTQGYYMDRKGWTRTASLWSDGYLVYGRWLESNSLLCMSYGYRDRRDANYGPRELFLAL